MDKLDRLKQLSSQMGYEPAEDAGCPKLHDSPAVNTSPLPEVSSAVLPNGKRISLLKTLITSACERNCYYCPFRAGRDFRRATLHPQEMADLFMKLHQGGIAEGLFLSSGVAGGGVRTQDQLISTAEILRLKHHYQGYLHLKIMPGAERDQIERAMQLADRVSVNLEAPNTHRLALLAPKKDFIEELLQPMRWIEETRKSRSPRLGWKNCWPSMTTQFVVGAAGEADIELLTTTAYLYQNLHLGRTYFSAFRPVPDTPLENQRPESPRRELRLYQASFLLRDYGFDLEDFPFDHEGQLPLDLDPKTAWARFHLADQPIEINHADKSTLLRIPGIGPKGARAIISSRRYGKITSLEDLRKLGINPGKPMPYILLNGSRPAQQLRFW